MIYIRIRTIEQADELLSILREGIPGGFEVCVLCPLKIGAGYADAFKACKAQVFADLPFIARENRADEIISDINAAAWAEGFVVKNMDELGILKSIGFEGPVIADPFLYAYNSHACKFYREQFPDIRFISSDELTDRELSGLSENCDLIYKAYGRARVMLSAQSLFDNYGGDHLESSLPGSFISANEDYGYASVYTGRPVSMPEAATGHKWENVMADLTLEDGKESGRVIRALFGHGVLPSGDKGHHFKGID